jgi:hypothetical protein
MNTAMISLASSMPARVSRKRHLIIDQPPEIAERLQFGPNSAHRSIP